MWVVPDVPVLIDRGEPSASLRHRLHAIDNAYLSSRLAPRPRGSTNADPTRPPDYTQEYWLAGIIGGVAVPLLLVGALIDPQSGVLGAALAVYAVYFLLHARRLAHRYLLETQHAEWLRQQRLHDLRREMPGTTPL